MSQENVEIVRRASRGTATRRDFGAFWEFVHPISSCVTRAMAEARALVARGARGVQRLPRRSRGARDADDG